LVDGTQPLIATQSSLAALQSNFLINLDNLNANVTGLPSLSSYSVDSISYIGSNSISNSGSYRVSTGSNYLYIEGLTLSNNGLIYVMVGDPSIWARDPLVSEMKKGSGPGGLPPLYFRILAYKTSAASSSYMAWTSMPSGTYNLYIMVSDSNPFDTANLSPITKTSISS
jgi:hypothetical protein